MRGDATGADARSLLKALAAFRAAMSATLPGEPLHFHLGELDTNEGATMAALASFFHELRDYPAEVMLHRAPQALAHSLYRVGDLRGTSLRLVEPREEIGAAY